MMEQIIDVRLIYHTVNSDELTGSVCVVADILRATTSIVHALGHGASRVIPCETIDQAWQLSNNYSKAEILRGGERAGVLIEGFHLDNSPWSYTSSQISGKTILFTTTNGTQAIVRCRKASQILIGAFSNLTSLSDYLSKVEKNIHVICAGTDGKLSLEDILFAGTLVEEISRKRNINVAKDDETTLAMSLLKSTGVSEIERLNLFKISRGGRNLLELEMDRDLERAANMDLYTVIPEWNPVTGLITAI